MKKKIIYTSFVIIILIAIGSIVVSKYVLPYAIIQPPKISLDISPSELNLNFSEVDVRTIDSINLKGYWIKTDDPPKSIVIFIHGIGGCKEHFLDLSKNLANIGIESILMDSRAHGQSEGEFCTYGYKEKEDISSVVDFIKSKNDNVPIGIWGNSMGGAIAIQALEHDTRIEFGIIESTFANLDDIVYDYQKAKTFNIGLKFICNMTLNEAGKLAEFEPSQVSPLSSVQHISQPVLIAHGDADENIKFDYGKLLYENLKSTDKQFITVENGGHFDLSIKGGNYYKEAIKTFLIKNSK